MTSKLFLKKFKNHHLGLEKNIQIDILYINDFKSVIINVIIAKFFMMLL